MARENGRVSNAPWRTRRGGESVLEPPTAGTIRIPATRPKAHAALAVALGLVAMVAVLAAGGGHPAQAATCADYPNQAGAQRAHDTRDADGDGIYCESLLPMFDC